MIELDREYIKNRSVRDPSTGCWKWKLYKDRGGYGIVSRGSNKLFAHRVSFTVYKHDPKELFVCHSCDNPSCVNPDHLFAGTPHDNVQDMLSKKRGAIRNHQGMNNPRNKLTLELVQTIYNEEGSQCAIADKYSISQTTVSRIKRRDMWVNRLSTTDG